MYRAHSNRYRLSNFLKLVCIVMRHELHDVCNIIEYI